MTLLLHGNAGAWDELLIAAVALAVLWIAVKLAGRKSVDDPDEPAAADEASLEEDHADSVPPAAPKLG